MFGTLNNAQFFAGGLRRPELVHVQAYIPTSVIEGLDCEIIHRGSKREYSRLTLLK